MTTRATVQPPRRQQRRIRVLQSVPANGTQTNPYLTRLAESLAPHVEVLGFSWPRALFGRWSVLHLHWPEVALRGSSPMRTAARHALFCMLLLRLFVGRRALVRTLHNTQAHETGSVAERRLLRACDRATTRWIRLNPFTALPEASRSGALHTIPHGDYADWAARHRPIPAALPGRLLAFGRIRPYKGIGQLLVAFAGIPETDVSLHVVGQPLNTALGDEIRALADDDERVALRLEYADDYTLAQEIGHAQLVVLPYADMHNSGALLLALTLARPVLVPANAVNAWLRDEFGARWVLTYDGELTADVLAAALAATGLGAAHADRGRVPDFDRRRWDDIALMHCNAYRAAIAAVSRTTADTADRCHHRAFTSAAETVSLAGSVSPAASGLKGAGRP